MVGASIWLSFIANVTCIVAFTVGRLGLSWPTLAIGGFIIAAVNIAITVAMMRKIIDPIRQLTVAANALAMGNPNPAIPPLGKNELRQLAQSIQGLIDYQVELTDLTLAMAEGDLSINIRKRSPDDRLSESFAWMLDSQRQLVLRMQRTFRMSQPPANRFFSPRSTAVRQPSRLPVQSLRLPKAAVCKPNTSDKFVI